MKRRVPACASIYLYPILILVSLILSVEAEAKTETFNISYDEADFAFTEDGDGNLHISTYKYPASYKSEEPGLPYLSADFAVKGGSRYESSSFTVSKRLIRTNVTMAQSPLPIPTNTDINAPVKREITYLSGTYPETNCRYVTFSDWGNIGTVHFLTCPFVYDSVEKNLYFVESIALTVTTSESSITENSRPARDNAVIVKGFVFNKEMVESLIVKPINSQNINDNTIEYVIITNEKLKSSFEPLAQWKTTKGVRAKILTINEILTKYQYLDRPYAIKKCLYDLYLNNGLKYVLLGGDDTIVPIRGCYARVDKYVDFSLPTDMYYSCFGGEFSWNSNGNNLYGEEEDGQDLSSNIFVTRLSVDNEEDVESFTNKLLQYEKDPRYTDSILLCGMGSVENIESDNKLVSDAEYHGNVLYSQYIHPYWEGTHFRFYDTGHDVPNEISYPFVPSNLQTQLEKGYAFININTHGCQTCLGLVSKTKYTINHVNRLVNNAHSIIVTSACLTNAFDTRERRPDEDFDLTNTICLSEGFIRNRNSGVIGYLGCSRFGWGCTSTDYIGTSEEYSAKFFKYLFSQDIPQKNFGRIVAAAKASMISKCSYFDDCRWVQYGLNPIGDPEMPIYISKPLLFDSISVEVSPLILKIKTGVDNCRICVMSKNDMGDLFYEVFDNVDSISLDNYPLDCSICITKQGYVPKHISFTFNSDLGIVSLGSSATSSEESVIFNNGSFITNDSNVIVQGTTIICNNTEFLIHSND